MKNNKIETEITKVLNTGLRRFAKDNGMNIKDLANAMGCSYSHTQNILNGTRTLKMKSLIQLSAKAGMKIWDMCAIYFSFTTDIEGVSAPGILIFTDDRTVDVNDKYVLLYQKEIDELGIVKAYQIWKDLTVKEIVKKATDIAWDIYGVVDANFYEELELTGNYNISNSINMALGADLSFVKSNEHREKLVSIIRKIANESDEFLEYLDKFIEITKKLKL